ERYLKEKMSRAVGSGSSLALAGVAFLAVYREGFETVLFYKALFISAGAGGLVPITGGFVVGCVGLVFLYLAFTRWGVKVPMRPFFAGTSAVLYFMAVVFAGQGIAELQAAGTVGTTPV
ncbi:MAG: FTR1 family protein, partial [Gemmatimonadota bacterium]